MFIKNGFNDFLSKPIDVSKLDEMLNRWIAKEKRAMSNEQLTMSNEQVPAELAIAMSNERQDNLPDKDNYSSFLTPNSSLFSIPGVDIQKGIAMVGGSIDIYRQILNTFREDAEKRLPLLQTAPEADALPAFVTQVHALKSASASIGAAQVSALAADLEKAGKAADMAFIQENLPAFAQILKELTENIHTAPQLNETAVPDFGSPHSSFLIPHSSLFNALAAALKFQKADDIDEVLERIMLQPLDPVIKAAVEQISDEVLIAEYDKAVEILDSVLKGEERHV
jgi:two-component system, sensor histidine kinase and response regulator